MIYADGRIIPSKEAMQKYDCAIMRFFQKQSTKHKHLKTKYKKYKCK